MDNMKDQISYLTTLLKDKSIDITDFSNIIIDMGLGEESLLSGLVYYALDNGLFDIDYIKEQYNTEIYNYD